MPLDLKKPDSFEVFQWPEFKALCLRLGVPLDHPITSICINLPKDGLVEVTLGLHGQDVTQKKDGSPVVVETTDKHTQDFKTFQPLSVQPREIPKFERRPGYGDN